MLRRIFGWTLIISIAAILPVRGQDIPLHINHQGVVAVFGERFTGQGEFRFALVDPGTGANLWTHDDTNVGVQDQQPDTAVSLTVISGLYAVRLGEKGNLIDPAIFDTPDVALRIWFDDTLNGTHLLTPDQPIASAPFAFHSATVDDNAITTEKIANGTVSTADLAGNAVTSAKITNGTVTAADLANNSVDTVEIADNAITKAKMTNGSVDTDELAGSAVTSAKIADGTVATTDLANNSVNGSKIQDGSVGFADLATGSVRSAEINDGAVGTDDLAGGAVTSLKIANGEVMTNDLADDAVTGSKINDGAVGANNLSSSGASLNKVSGGKMWMNSNNVGIGTDSATARLHIQYDGSHNAIHMNNDADPDSSTNGGINQGQIRMNSSGFLRMRNRIDATWAQLDSSGSWSCCSDRNYKSDISPLGGLLSKALALKPVSFYYKTLRNDPSAEKQIGFIAQEVEGLLPSLVSGTEGEKTMNYSGLGVVAIGAIHEMHAEVESLQAENDDLRDRLECLEALVATFAPSESKRIESAPVLKVAKVAP